MLLKQDARLPLGRVLSLCQYRDGALRANGWLGAWMVLEERVKIKHLHFIFAFPLRELNAVPICPVDKEVIKPQEVSRALIWLGVGEGTFLQGDIQVGTQLIAHSPPLWVRSHSPPVCLEHEWVLLTTPHPDLTTFLH